MANIIAAVGNTLHPIGASRVLPDGRILVPPTRRSDGSVEGDDLIRYITPGQRILSGWARLPWLLIPVVLLGIAIGTGFVRRFPLYPGENPAHLAFILGFIGYWLLLAVTFFVLMRLSETIDAQIYEPDA
jgi:hypothetical protein